MEERGTTRKGSFANPSKVKVKVDRRGRIWAEELIMTGILIRRGECLRVDAVDAVISRATCGQHTTQKHIRVIGTREELYDGGRAKHVGYHRKCMGTPGKPLNIRNTAAEWCVCW